MYAPSDVQSNFKWVEMQTDLKRTFYTISDGRRRSEMRAPFFFVRRARAARSARGVRCTPGRGISLKANVAPLQKPSKTRPGHTHPLPRPGLYLWDRLTCAVISAA
jgi:hypothetical protein